MRRCCVGDVKLSILVGVVGHRDRRARPRRARRAHGRAVARARGVPRRRRVHRDQRREPRRCRGRSSILVAMVVTVGRGDASPACRRCASAGSRSRSPPSRSRSSPRCSCSPAATSPPPGGRCRARRSCAATSGSTCFALGGARARAPRAASGRRSPRRAACSCRGPRHRAARPLLRRRAGSDQAPRLRALGRDRRAGRQRPRVEGGIDQRQGSVPARSSRCSSSRSSWSAAPVRRAGIITAAVLVKGLPQFIVDDSVHATCEPDRVVPDRVGGAARRRGRRRRPQGIGGAVPSWSGGSLDRALGPAPRTPDATSPTGRRRDRRAHAAVLRDVPASAAVPHARPGAARGARRAACTTAASPRSTASSLEVRRGEIVGLIGANGAGQVDLLQRGLGLRADHRLDPLPRRRARRSARRRAAARSASRARSRTSGWCAPRPSSRTCCSRRRGSRATRRRRDRRAGLDRARPSASCAAAPSSRSSCSVSTTSRDERLGDLPYGTMRIVEIASAVAAGPDLLLLDEATAGLGSRRVARARRPVPRVARRAGAHARDRRAPRAADRARVRLRVLPRVGRAHRRGPPDDVTDEPRGRRVVPRSRRRRDGPEERA